MADLIFRVRVTEAEASKAIIAGIRKEVEQLQASTAGLGRSTAQSATALKGVQAAANQAAEGYRRVRTFAEEVAEVNRLLPASLKQSGAAMAQAGREAAEAFTVELRRAYELAQADTKEALARGLITPEEAMERGRGAGRAFNAGILSIIETQATRGGLSGRRGQDMFVGLTDQLKNLDGAANKASIGGLRNLARNFATIATQQLAFRSGLGSIISTLGLLTIGTGLTLGVTAGLAAIALGIKKIKEAAQEANEPVRRLTELAERLRQARLAPFELQGDEPLARLHVDEQQEAVDRLAQSLEAARRRLNEMPDLIGAGANAQADVTRLTRQHTEALAELTIRQNKLNGLVHQGGVEAIDRRGEEISALARLIDAGAASNAQLERRQVLLGELQAELKKLQADEELLQQGVIGTDPARQTWITKIVNTKEQIDTLLDAGVRKEREVTRLNREQLDIELARLQLRSIALQTRVASREISAPDALQEELKLLEERRQILARSIPLLQAQANLLKTPEARAGVAQVTQELAQTNLQIAQLTDETREWQRTLADLEFAHIQEQLLLANPAEAFRQTFERSHGALRDAAEQAGDVASVALWDRILSRGITTAEAEKMQDTLQKALAGVGRDQQALEIQLDTREISRDTFLQRRIELLEKERDIIRDAIPQIRAYAEALKDPRLLESVADMELRFAQIGERIHEVRVAMEEWNLALIEISEDALVGLFTDLMSATKSYKDAFLDMAQAVVQALTRMIAQMLAARIAQAALGSLFGLGGGLSPLGIVGLLGGFARGGLVRGPGSATSDSIPARLSDGEYVVRASAVRRPGIKELLDAINAGSGPVHLRPRHSPMRFAEGGLVERPRGGAELSGHLDIGLSEGLMVRELETNAAARALLRVVARNPKAFRRAMDS